MKAALDAADCIRRAVAVRSRVACANIIMRDAHASSSIAHRRKSIGRFAATSSTRASRGDMPHSHGARERRSREPSNREPSNRQHKAAFAR
ncbi:hypothetical protein WS91_05995 [Burkholderia sp. MSMB1498]|nr:hypothetical protein WS91_05995 [Burkholderia sp. MSMB1498]